MDILIKVIQLILALSIMVFLHELGHFGFARLFKVGLEGKAEYQSFLPVIRSNSFERAFLSVTSNTDKLEYNDSAKAKFAL